MGNEKKNTNPPASHVARDAAKGKQLLERRRNRGKGAEADWSTVDAGRIFEVVRAVTATGCAVTFGYTKDGGACTITVLADGETDTTYIRPTEDMDYALQTLIEDFTMF